MKSTEAKKNKVTVDIDELIMSFAMDADAFDTYVNKKTGKIVSLSTDMLEDPEDLTPLGCENLPQWQQEVFLLAQQIIQSPDEYVFFSYDDSYDAFQIMEDFCFTIAEDDLRQILLNVLGGKGSFRRFRDAIHLHGLENQWYAFEQEQQRQIACDWCLEQGFAISTHTACST